MDKPIRVLAVVCQMQPAGLENRLMDIIRNMDSSRIQIDIFTYREEEGHYDREIKGLGGKVYYNVPLTVKNMFWYVNYFKKFLIRHPEYKIIHAHQDAWCSVFCKGACLAGVPVRIAHSRTAINTLSLTSVMKNIIKLPTRRYATHYFAVSEKAGRWLYGNRFFDKGEVQVWQNAIDAEPFFYDVDIRKQVRKENGWTEKYIVMHVGNFTYPKNHLFLLKIFKEIEKADRSTLLVLAGTGEHNHITAFIKENRLQDKVLLLGSRRDVNKLLQGADVFLFPSLFEGLPGALVEAQASGLPCVISDTIAEEVCIIPEIQRLSLNNSINLWAEQVLKYKNYIRTDTRKYIKSAGFDIHSLIDKLMDFYESAAEEGIEHV